MRAVIQRAREARVEIEREIAGVIGPGLVVFVGVGKDDTEADARYLVDKIAGMRVFEDENGKMSRSVADTGGALLIVSQFTLYGDLSRGRRPSFDRAMPPGEAEKLYDAFVALARKTAIPVETGRFGANMRVLVDGNGPVTLLLDSAQVT